MNVQTVLKLWRFRTLNLEGRMVVLKSLAESKTVFKALIAILPIQIIKTLETIKTPFLWNNSNLKIKHEIISKNLKEGGLKNVNIQNELTSLQILWIPRLYDDCFREWKIIPLYVVKRTVALSFKFFFFNKSKLKKLLPFNREMVISWSQYLSSSPEIPSQILS